jgi:Asp-tRNA(Asn)/Glu-tRNA(Gln) amidotransferase A subunit family amidase
MTELTRLPALELASLVREREVTSREIVEAHGGSIRVDSCPGEGATFHVELPMNAGRKP